MNENTTNIDKITTDRLNRRGGSETLPPALSFRPPSRNPEKNRFRVKPGMTDEQGATVAVPSNATCFASSASAVPSNTTCFALRTSAIPLSATCFALRTSAVPSNTTCFASSASAVPSNTTYFAFCTSAIPSRTMCFALSDGRCAKLYRRRKSND